MSIAPYLTYTHLLLVLISGAISLVFIALTPRYPRLAGGNQRLVAVQTMHKNATARVGGVGIFIALIIGLVIQGGALLNTFAPLLLAATLLFLVALAEDLGFDISPRMRLLAAAGATILAAYLLGIWLPRFDIPLVDPLMHSWPIGIILTIFLCAGVANGFNLIDGLNGLSASASLIGAIGISMIALRSGNMLGFEMALLLSAAIVGFLLLNYPAGYIFMGDAGAYTIGFLLCWIGIIILTEHNAVTPWAIYLCVFWPVSDMLFAIYRRVIKKQPAMQPDRLHMHQLVMRALQIRFLGRTKRHIANPITTLVLIPFIAAPPLCGVLLFKHTKLAVLMVLAFSILFCATYVWIARVLARRRKRILS